MVLFLNVAPQSRAAVIRPMDMDAVVPPCGLPAIVSDTLGEVQS